MFILWSVAIILISIGVLVSILNWIMVFETWRTGRFHSCVPLIGAGFILIGTLPLSATRPYVWLALLDIGTLLWLPRFLGSRGARGAISEANRDLIGEQPLAFSARIARSER